MVARVHNLEHDIFAYSTTIMETMGNFCPNTELPLDKQVKRNKKLAFSLTDDTNC